MHTNRLGCLLRGLWLCLASGGLDYLRAWRLALVVGQRAPSFATGSLLLVPGYRLHEDEVARPYARRLRRAVRLWRPAHRVLLSGRATFRGGQSEALAGYGFLRDLGLPASADVELDVVAADTADNLCQARSRALPGDSLVIISNRWHLARCALLARQFDMPAKLCAAERHWHTDLFVLMALSREAFALLCFCGREAAAITPRQLLEPQR